MARRLGLFSIHCRVVWLDPFFLVCGFRPVLKIWSFCFFLPGAGQVDKLVQLLESPIFLRLRLQLLDVDSPSYPALLKSLYGILMLLPQVTVVSVPI